MSHVKSVSVPTLICKGGGGGGGGTGGKVKCDNLPNKIGEGCSISLSLQRKASVFPNPFQNVQMIKGC